jgi:hypothetical protein
MREKVGIANAISACLRRKLWTANTLVRAGAKLLLRQATEAVNHRLFSDIFSHYLAPTIQVLRTFFCWSITVDV